MENSMCILFCAFINFVSFDLDQEMENVLCRKHFVFLLEKFLNFLFLFKVFKSWTSSSVLFPKLSLSNKHLMIPNIFQKCLWRGSPQFCHYSILSFQLPRCTLHATQHVKHFAIYLKYLWWKASIY